MNSMIQPRAKAGGERGLNGEWYEGGKFLPSTEARPKTPPPPRWQPTPEELAERESRRQRDAEATARLRAWISVKRSRLHREICALLRRSNWEDPASWAWRIRIGSGLSFHESLGLQLLRSGSLSERQARYACDAAHGRRSRRNAEVWDTAFDAMVEDFK